MCTIFGSSCQEGLRETEQVHFDGGLEVRRKGESIGRTIKGKELVHRGLGMGRGVQRRAHLGQGHMDSKAGAESGS